MLPGRLRESYCMAMRFPSTGCAELVAASAVPDRLSRGPVASALETCGITLPADAQRVQRPIGLGAPRFKACRALSFAEPWAMLRHRTGGSTGKSAYW